MNRYRITFLAAALLLFAALPARGAERQAQSADGSIEAVCSLPGDGAGIAASVFSSARCASKYPSVQSFIFAPLLT